MAALDYADALKTYALSLNDTAESCSAWARRVADEQMAWAEGEVEP